MKKIFFSIWLGITMLSPFAGCQVPEQRPKLTDQQLDQKLTTLLRFSVPLMGVEELQADLQQDSQSIYLLDTREKEEYQVSHIPGAIHLGYDNWKPEVLKDIPKDAKVVLYCSVGYRSDRMGKTLKKEGFENVYNLYGSVFEWVNRGYPLEDPEGNTTRKVHTYNEKWSQWVDGDKAEKTW